MPLYMDRHYIEGVLLDDIKFAHEKDLELQGDFDATMLTYWFDEGRGTTFCLVSAPNADSITGLHAAAHGEIPNDVVEVDQSDVLKFMGRIADIPPAEQVDNLVVDRGLKSIMFTDIVDYTAITSRLGDTQSFKLVRAHNTAVRDALTKHAGREVKHTGDGIMAAFDKADDALVAAHEIVDAISGVDIPEVDETLAIRVGIAAGEPLIENGDLFGSVVNLASRLCDLAEPGEILCDAEFVRDLSAPDTSVEVVGKLPVKGFDSPIEVNKAVGQQQT
jgi:class 3 adenylate cyclase